MVFASEVFSVDAQGAWRLGNVRNVLTMREIRIAP